MKKLLTDKRFWAAVIVLVGVALGAAGVRIPPGVVAAIEAVIQAIPDGTPDPIDQPATHDDASEQPDPVTAEGTPPPSTGEGSDEPSPPAEPALGAPGPTPEAP